MRFFKFFFFQTTPPGPIRGYLELFLILATFHRVIKVLKWLPGIWDTVELQISNIPDARHRVLIFLLFFKLQANLPSSGTPGIRESLVAGTSQSEESPECRMPGSRESISVSDTRDSFFDCTLFFQTSSHCYSF